MLEIIIGFMTIPLICAVSCIFAGTLLFVSEFIIPDKKSIERFEDFINDYKLDEKDIEKDYWQ